MLPVDTSSHHQVSRAFSVCQSWNTSLSANLIVLSGDDYTASWPALRVTVPTPGTVPVVVTKQNGHRNASYHPNNSQIHGDRISFTLVGTSSSLESPSWARQIWGSAWGHSRPAEINTSNQALLITDEPQAKLNKYRFICPCSNQSLKFYPVHKKAVTKNVK